ncbi:acyl-CoA N-acyltransferase [Sistotremastrum niveocremeum HHB9708]|uniref:Acyl-CoA N-acyltransferase n=2 Tax=Sistotremastraceae TaxID=3402574 RepID=A0A164MZE2_9AGAM|nr:acyl-CoA N-acyltransferase [Sistotremastrum niveocremeum HHB9708]KZT36385.1 acyl-CoA N-acyltransferase [Sistotremastrum suecicum HHB10207 ss-3]
MSAYGALVRKPSATQKPTQWPLDPTPANEKITIYHLTLETAPEALLRLMYSDFQAEVEAGMTYPQEGDLSLEQFSAYYFAADVLVAISQVDQDGNAELTEEIEVARKGRSWEEAYVGCYYVKPNYPGRSSHICNAGFMVPARHRAKGYGRLLAASYLHYAPLLGYEASVFNLVYTNNAASIRLWDRLGFTRAGLIPRAGRLKTADGKGEEFVDAIIFYKRF